MAEPEAWLRGPVEGISAQLQPVAHALLQAREDLREQIPSLPQDEMWGTPGGAASVGFHLVHLAGSLDRLFTYARGEALSPEQRAALERERTGSWRPAAGELLNWVEMGFDRAMEQLRSTPDSVLDLPREVGRARLPATVRGLLFYGAEHTTRHVGQVITTLKIMQGWGGARRMAAPD
jgi:uncharacterized damage-inducible protein DinB